MLPPWLLGIGFGQAEIRAPRLGMSSLRMAKERKRLSCLDQGLVEGWTLRKSLYCLEAIWIQSDSK